MANNENMDAKKLAVLLTEARSRGLTLPAELTEKKKHKWPVDSKGYFPRMDGRQYIPSEQQAGFVSSRGVVVGFSGSRASGKSSAGAQKALAKIMAGENGAVINPDFENLKVSTWPELREWIPWEMVVPAHKYRRNPEFDPHQPFTMAFVNGVRVIVKGVKDPDSARGPNINWLWDDEAQRDDSGLSWQTAIASVRVGHEPQAWATFTPAGTDHWTYKTFVKKEIPEEAAKLFEALGSDREMIEFYHGSIYDNQANLDPGYMANMLTAYPSGWLRQQEIYGEFVAKEGALGDRRWFDGKIIPKTPDYIHNRLRFWDLAATERKITGKKFNDPDETVGTRMSWDKTYFYVEDQVAVTFDWDKIKETILNTAILDGPTVKIVVEQEPASGGKNQVAEIASFIQKKLPGHPKVVGWPPPSDRIVCANTWFAEAKQGLVFLVAGDWNEPFLTQLGCFPECRHDDKITSVNGARYNLAPIKIWQKIHFLHL